MTFTISQNTLRADAVSRHSTSVGYCGFPRVLRSSHCATALIILETTEVKLYTSAQCSECRSFGLAAWGVGGEREKAANQRHSCDQNIMSPSVSFCLWEIIPHTPLWEWAAPVRSSPEIQTYLELPLMARNTKEQFCFSYTCGPYATDINVLEAFLAPWMFLVPQFVWDPKMDSVCIPEPKWSLSDLVKPSDIW